VYAQSKELVCECVKLSFWKLKSVLLTDWKLGLRFGHALSSRVFATSRLFSNSVPENSEGTCPGKCNS
jgi:hypothetical protein